MQLDPTVVGTGVFVALTMLATFWNTRISARADTRSESAEKRAADTALNAARAERVDTLSALVDDLRQRVTLTEERAVVAEKCAADCEERAKGYERRLGLLENGGGKAL